MKNIYKKLVLIHWSTKYSFIYIIFNISFHIHQILLYENLTVLSKKLLVIEKPVKLVEVNAQKD